MAPAQDFTVINFRVSPEDHKQLRILLFQQGITMQKFFTTMVKDTLAQQTTGQRKGAAKEVRNA